MTSSLSIGDIVIHRILGRGRIESRAETTALVHIFGKHGTRLVRLRDCEKAPEPLGKRPPLRLVK